MLPRVPPGGEVAEDWEPQAEKRHEACETGPFTHGIKSTVSPPPFGRNSNYTKSVKYVRTLMLRD